MIDALLAALIAELTEEEERVKDMQFRPLRKSGGSSVVVAPPGAPAFVSAEIGNVNAVTVAVTFDSACVTPPVVEIIVNGVVITSDGGTIQGDPTIVYYVIDDGFYNNADVFTVDGNAVTNNEDIMKATITLTDAQIKALPTTPICFVPDPGAGKTLVPLMAFISLDPSGGVYGNIDAASGLFIGSGRDYIREDSVNWAYPIINNAGTDKTAEALYPHESISLGGNGAIQNYFEGTGLELSHNNSLGNFTGGHASNTMRVTIIYIVVDLL